ncbi:hypothetical protein O9X98_06915 [Agrobacterium salinitolerans]|nr:hypothetical protein [Agrobacterium salinitolerans]
MTVTYYASTAETPSVSSFVSVADRMDGNVFFSNAWGGFVRGLPEAEFAARFREVPKAEFDRLMNRFSPIKVTADEGETSMDGWTNDERWNGWQVPRFTKETILEAFEEGGSLGHPDIRAFTRFVYHEATNNIFEITSRDGGNLPAGFDLDKINEAISSDEGVLEAMSEGMGVWVNRANRVVFTSEGETDPVVAFEIGNGWCWEDMDRFEPAEPQPAPARRM